ncbi:MAG TPA: hypothetical protein VEI73_07130 [Candidatus Acidoferrum sp.]|nr:hypothetical protein [Candidatus Acidoferrum sp.]
MNETKAPESAYSGERTEITGAKSLRSSFEPEKSPENEKPGAESKSAQTASKPESSETSKVSGTLPKPAGGGGVLAGATAVSGASVVSDFVGFLNRTKYIWLFAGAAIFGVMALVTVQKRMAEQAKKTREARQEQAVTTISVEALLARCGQPAEDVTKDMYPMLVRTMTYQPRENEKVVFEFSRTAEQNSQWLFLSMKDPSGARKLDTPEAKIAALPCLDTKK